MCRTNDKRNGANSYDFLLFGCVLPLEIWLKKTVCNICLVRHNSLDHNILHHW